MTSCAGGTYTVRNTLPSGVSSIPLLPLRTRFSINACSGSPATSAALTSRCWPLATSVTTTAARRAARSAFRDLRMSSFMTADPTYSVRSLPPCARADRPSSLRLHTLLPSALLHLLHKNPDRAAAGEPDLPGGLVGDAEFERLGLAALDHVEGFGHDRALDAAARDRAEEVALVVDHQIRAHRTRRRAPGLDHGRERNPTPFRSPVLCRFENVFVAREHDEPSAV